MYGRTTMATSYGRVANVETNPIQQIVALYDGAIKFTRLAASDIEAGDLAAKAEHSNRALDIIVYLQSTLDFERGGDVAPVLDTLYSCVSTTILQGSAKLDAQLMRRAAELLAPVREAWMTNAQAATMPVAPPPAPGARPQSISFAT